MRYRLCAMTCLASLITVLFLGSDPFVASTAPQDPIRSSGEQPPSPAKPNAQSIPLHNGDGPFGPPDSTDSLFWTDAGPTMDVYLFRDEGPIEFAVQLDRLVGRTDGNGFLLDPQHLVENGILSEKAHLQLLVWDVDEDYAGTEWNPEADRVYVNGHYVGDLSGANDTWSLTRLEFDVSYLKFAVPSCSEYGDPGGQQYLSQCSTPPTPVMNDIRIDIDTTNTDLIWAVEVDWAALSFEAARPILFVHGKGGSEDSSLPCGVSGGGFGCLYWDNYDGEHYFNFRGKLSRAGFLTAITENYLGGEVSLAENARRLQPIVQGLKNRYGVDRVNIVGHSKGGLDSRAYISNSALNNDNDVATLVTLASPHHGSFLADVARNLPEFALGWIGYTNSPALQNVSENYMDRTFNPTHPAWTDVEYFSVAADAGEDYWYGRHVPLWQILALPDLGWRAGAAFTWFTLYHFGAHRGNNDFLVTVDSTQWSGIPGHNGSNSHQLGSYALNHHSIRAAMQQAGQEDSMISDLVMELLDVRSGGHNSYFETPFTPPGTLETSSSTQEAYGSALGVTSGLINQGQTVDQTIGVDSQSMVSFMLLWNDGELFLSLVDPLGRLVTPGTVDPNIAYVEDRSGSMLGEFFVSSKVISYRIIAPESGPWIARLSTGGSLPGGKANWVMMSSQESDLVVSLSTDAEWHPMNDAVALFATVKAGAYPVLGASVQATAIAPTGTAETLTLYDDGSHGDLTSGDGVYSNSFVGDQFGIYGLSVAASGTTAKGVPFLRTATDEVQVSSGTAAFGVGYSDLGLDTDGDGLFNLLRINVPLEVTTGGDYMVAGVLHDSLGTVMGRTSTIATLPAGNPLIATLDFDGRLIWANGGQGSFTLQDLRLLDRSSVELPVQVDYSSSAYSTHSYGRCDFQHSPVALTGISDDYGLDTNGNGKYDELVIHVQAYVEKEGNYTWNARLVDGDDVEFAWDSDDGHLPVGNSMITFRYDGQALYSHHLNGPYSLKDLALWGDGGYVTVVNVASTQGYRYVEFEPVFTPVFLPAVLRNHRSGNSTPIQNGDFELGPGFGWQEYSSNGWDLILDSDSLPIPPHGGNWAAWLGGDDSETSVVSQRVGVPTQNPTLRFWLWVDSGDACGYDSGRVLINGYPVIAVDLCDETDTAGWVQLTVDLRGYAGQTVELKIRVETDSSLISNLFVDDVTLGGASVGGFQNIDSNELMPGRPVPVWRKGL